MPRLRYFSPENLDFFQSRSQAGKEVNKRLASRIKLFKKSSLKVISESEYDELLWEMHTEPTLRELASQRSTSASTEMRRRHAQPQLLERMKIAMIATQIADSLAKKHGITIDPAVGESLALQSGYLVSMHTFGMQYRQNPSFDVIDRWLFRNAAHLNDYYPGGWYDKPIDTYWLDFNQWLPTAREAEVFAIQEQQKAYYDLKNRKEIRIPPAIERKAV